LPDAFTASVEAVAPLMARLFLLHWYPVTPLAFAVSVTLPPAQKVVGPEAVIVAAAQVAALLVVEALAVLLAADESCSFAETVAVFVIVPGAVATTTMVIVALPPFPRMPTLHVTVAVPLHEPCVEVADANDVPPGSVSVTVTPVAPLGPLLVTVIV
jgi:hypothetical protein